MTRGTRAFTLAELVMAMAIMSIIGLAVVGMTMALTDAQEYSGDFYRNVQIARHALRYVQREIPKANLVTAVDSDSLAYWLEDTNDNGGINLTEMRLIAFESGDCEIAEYRIEFPSGWTQFMKDLADIPLSLAWVTDISNVKSIRSESYVVRRVLATEVASAAFTASPGPPMTKLLQTEVTIGQGDRRVALRNAVALRADWVGHVGTVDDDWVLDTE